MIFFLIPYPSDPKTNTFLPSQLFSVKFLFDFLSKALIQNPFSFKYLIDVFMLETVKIFMCSAAPLAYKGVSLC